MRFKNLNLIYFIAFIEGASVMSVELSGVKMIAPYYGSTLYVWASVLSVTLGGLALGYFLGGRIANQIDGSKSCPVILLTGALLIAFMPGISILVMPATDHFGIRIGSLISATLFIMPPLVFMGMISPVIIQLGLRELKNAGKLAGTIYTVSTTGGIIMTLLLGFYLLPEWGIKKTIMLTSSLLAFCSFVFFLYRKKYLPGIITGSVAFILSITLFKNPNENKLSGGILYQREGVLGQVEVYDYLDTLQRKMRTLLLDGVSQNLMVEKYKPFSSWSYPHRISTLASIKPVGSKALLIGLAGGNLAMELKGLGFILDAIEIDNRMPKIAEKYFGFDPAGINIIIDDGRHYINNTTSTYDLIVIDVVNGETQPNHIFTMEAFESLKKIINPDGLIMINFQGYLVGNKGLAGRSIFKTLENFGFQLNYFSSQKGDEDGDILFIASLEKQDFRNKEINDGRLNLCCQILGLQLEYSDLITDSAIDLNDAIILTDDKPIFEKLNISWTEEWRKKRIADYSRDLANNFKLSLFK